MVPSLVLSGLTKVDLPMYGNSKTSRYKLRFAAGLRRRLTNAELKLWEELRKKRLEGSRWRQQAPVFGYIADFYCPKYRLILEVDGGYHSTPEQQKKDRHRDAALRGLGFQILRLSNERVVYDTEYVLNLIRAIVTQPEPVGPLNKRRG